MQVMSFSETAELPIDRDTLFQRLHEDAPATGGQMWRPPRRTGAGLHTERPSARNPSRQTTTDTTISLESHTYGDTSADGCDHELRRCARLGARPGSANGEASSTHHVSRRDPRPADRRSQRPSCRGPPKTTQRRARAHRSTRFPTDHRSCLRDVFCVRLAGVGHRDGSVLPNRRFVPDSRFLIARRRIGS